MDKESYLERVDDVYPFLRETSAFMPGRKGVQPSGCGMGLI